MNFDFIQFPSFTVTAEGVLSEQDIIALEDVLERDPEAGDRIPGTGGARKIRVAMEGRGKRGGARVVYYYVARRSVIYLIAVYAKNQASTLSEAGKKFIKSVTRELDNE